MREFDSVCFVGAGSLLPGGGIIEPGPMPLVQLLGTRDLMSELRERHLL